MQTMSAEASNNSPKQTKDPVDQEQPISDNDPKKQEEITQSSILPDPPSHILATGQFIHLPKPTAAEHSVFFQRAIVTHQLVSAHQKGSASSEETSLEETLPQHAKTDADDDVVTKIHPLAIASARVDGVGVAELSKAINLGTLVASNEYFGWANIVSQEGIEAVAAAAAAMDKAKAAESSKESESNKPEPQQPLSAERLAKKALDSKLRAAYILKRKHACLTEAASFLQTHQSRLRRSTLKQRLVDRRYWLLRHEWRLVAPEHGTRVLGPVRSDEVVAVDVETYQRDRVGGGSSAVRGANDATTKRRLARMVPRYATIELESATEQEMQLKVGNADGEQQNYNAASQMQIDTDKDQSNGDLKDDNPKLQSSAQMVQHLSKQLKLKTKAEPYAVADPTLGKLDLDFNPTKVPVWTLQLSITKTSTGFSATSTLPYLFLNSMTIDNNNNNNQTDSELSSSDDPPTKKPSNDECVIQSLQHSLFCASLFDAIRHEISTSVETLPSAKTKPSSSLSGSSPPRKKVVTTTSVKAPATQSTGARPTVWISSEMEESYLPPPLALAGGGVCVIYCQEGEVKVQLDSEYALTIKLMEMGTATAVNVDNLVEAMPAQSTLNVHSGSQTPEQLQSLCRSLLLHAQFIYHDFCTRNLTRANTTPSSSENLSSPIPRKPQLKCARILQHCVGFGSKVLLEGKIRRVLKVQKSVARIGSMRLPLTINQT